jgi:glutaconate CoA-transferase subunit B
MVCEMARAIRDGETVFHGVASPMPMAAILLARATHAKTLTYLNLTGGVNPAGIKPERYSSITGNLAEQGNCYFPLADIFDLAMRGALHPASTTHRRMNDAQLRAAGVSADPVRLSVGIEDPGDLMYDINRVLSAI